MKTIAVLVLMFLGEDGRPGEVREFVQPDHQSCVAALAQTQVGVMNGSFVLTCKLREVKAS